MNYYFDCNCSLARKTHATNHNPITTKKDLNIVWVKKYIFKAQNTTDKKPNFLDKLITTFLFLIPNSVKNKGNKTNGNSSDRKDNFPISIFFGEFPSVFF